MANENLLTPAETAALPTAEHTPEPGFANADGGMWWLDCSNEACVDFDNQRHLGMWYVGDFSEAGRAGFREGFANHLAEIQALGAAPSAGLAA